MDYPAVFVSTLFHSGTNAHFMHLQADSYAKHKALQKYYEGIIDLTDSWAEAYQGCYEQIKSYPKDFHLATDPVKYITGVKAFVKDIRYELPKDTDLQNICDEIAQLLDSTLYKLKAFK
jgi:DNA-binding ferritin-like protein